MTSTHKKIVFSTVLVLLVLSTIEGLAYLFFTTFTHRFTLLTDKRYTIEASMLKNCFDAQLGWDCVQQRPMPVTYQHPLMATFGDSFTYGAEVARHQTWQTYLAALLKADIYNFGVTGYGTDQAYLKFLLHYPDVNTPLVSLGLILENINRIVNVYRPFYAPNSHLAFTKPRFKIVDDQLVLIENPIQRREDYAKLQDLTFLQSLAQYDWWYYLDDFPQLKFPYSRLLFNRRIWLEAYYGRGHRRVDDMTPRPWANLWEEPAARALMFKLLASFVDKAKAAQATPIIMIFPNRSEVIDAFKGKPIEALELLLAHCQEQGYLCFEGISVLAEAINSIAEVGALYEEVHLSPQGNRLIAEAFLDYLQPLLPAYDKAR